MIPTYCIVPVRNRLDVTTAFLEMMRGQEFDDLLVLDNGSDDGTAGFLRRARRDDPRLHVSRRPQATVYQMWNHGFAWARRNAKGQPFNCAVLNNDITLPPDGIGQLARWLRSADPDVWLTYPDYDQSWDWRPGQATGIRETQGIFRQGGMFGPCWMVAGERIPWPELITDTGYEIWFGDDYFALEMQEAGGRQMRVVGLPILHLNEATTSQHPELEHAKLRDRGRWIRRTQSGL